MLQKNEYSYMNKLIFYYIFAVLEAMCFAMVIKTLETKGRFIRDAFSVFLSIILSFTFIADGLINKNIYQIKHYLLLSVYSIVLSVIGLGITKNVTYNWEIVFIVLLVIDSCVTAYFGKVLTAEFKWFYYKKYGLSVGLQDMYKIKQQMVVYFKLDIILTLITLLYPFNKLPYKKPIIITAYTMGILSVFLFITFYDTENYAARYLTMFCYCVKIVCAILEVVAFSFVVSAENIFIPVANFYNGSMDVLLIYYLYKDSRNFGKGLQEAINKNNTATYTGLS